MDEAKHNENRALLEDLTGKAPVAVAKVLKCYDYDTDGDYIYKQLDYNNVKRELQVAAEYLKHIPAAVLKKKKHVLVKAIISRINNLLLENCRKCKEYYSVGREDTPVISCSDCGQGAHNSCYVNVDTIIADYPGLQYLCSRCAIVKKAIPEEPDTQTEGVTSALDSTAHSHTIHQDQSHEHDDDDDELQPVCQRYRRGVCPHGITGQNLHDGHKCNYRHPKRCQRFCRYGSDDREGCDKGRDCELLHPILCRYSVRDKMCTNLRCKFTHLAGTKRYKPRDRSDMDREYNHSGVDNQGQYSQGGYPVDRPRYNNPHTQSHSNPNPHLNANNDTPNQEAMPFLLQLTGQIKEMQKEMKEMRSFFKPYHCPPVPPWQQNHPATQMAQMQYQNQPRVSVTPQTAGIPQQQPLHLPQQPLQLTQHSIQMPQQHPHQL